MTFYSFLLQSQKCHLLQVKLFPNFPFPLFPFPFPFSFTLSPFPFSLFLFYFFLSPFPQFPPSLAPSPFHFPFLRGAILVNENIHKIIIKKRNNFCLVFQWPIHPRHPLMFLLTPKFFYPMKNILSNLRNIIIKRP